MKPVLSQRQLEQKVKALAVANRSLMKRIDELTGALEAARALVRQLGSEVQFHRAKNPQTHDHPTFSVIEGEKR